MTPQQLSERLWQFAARIAKVVDALPETRVGRHVAGQIVRSGIAAAPNYDEAVPRRAARISFTRSILN
ncbi:MAG: hypothetical protein ABSF38_16310 [Verrucomicrobiota bacterium]|jgi:hypothetical protein